MLAGLEIGSRSRTYLIPLMAAFANGVFAGLSRHGHANPVREMFYICRKLGKAEL